MTARDERARGIEILTDILTSGRILHLRQPRTLNDGYAYFFEVTAYDKLVDFCLPAEVLEDMEGTREYRNQANSFARALETRLRNPSPNSFMTKLGTPVKIESFWPHEAWSGRAASFVRTDVVDLSTSKLAKCFVVVTHQQNIFELKTNPFIEFGGIVNSVRDAVDARKVIFYEDGNHPLTLQQVDLRLEQRERQNPRTLETFLESKVFWLGFKTGNASSSVWVADPWDADYLGATAPELLREAEILDARTIVQLDQTREFASTGRELLLCARQMETRTVVVKSIKQQAEPTPEWDIFISHASEDKESFVHPLAQELTSRGIHVWYDKFTLKLGDSLREKIDYGLRYSKFGVVVLSPNFFKKDWPKKELDGLVALEVEGRKMVLPVWHNVTQSDVAGYSPILASRLAVSSSTGLDNVVNEIMRAIE